MQQQSQSTSRRGRTRLQQQIAFLAELDRLKSVLRRNTLIDGSRRENTAEHSWHLGMLAIVLAEYADEPIDVLHVVKMVLVHDVVEIDAGDTFCYDEDAKVDKRELAAAERLFALLPADQAKEFRALWDEYDATETAEAKFAHALDRLQPLLLNYRSGGGTWKEFDVCATQVLKRVESIGDGSEALLHAAKSMLDDAMRSGILRDNRTS